MRRTITIAVVGLITEAALTGCDLPDSDGDTIPDYFETLEGWDPNDSDEDGNAISDGIQDTDDGISDWLELGLLDSDGDARSDLEEVLHHRTDPFDADTDDDTWDDGVEIAFGADPLDPADHP